MNDIREFIQEYDLKMVTTVIAIITLYVLKYLANKVALRRIKSLDFTLDRKVLIAKMLNLFFLIGILIVLLAIWGINSSQVMLFISSTATILGVAFFAAWSILSNITASMILFFSHPMKIGSYIRVLDKDVPLEGTVKDIAFFFIKLRTDDGEDVSIPNNVILQKSISVIYKNAEENPNADLKL